MRLAEKTLRLQEIDPFSRIGLEELVIFADATRVLVFGAGEVVCEAGHSLARLLVVVSGAVVGTDGRPLDPVLGIYSLLFHHRSAETLRASAEDGAVCLCLRKGQFFTLIHQCPVLLEGCISPRANHGGTSTEAKRI